MVRTPFELHTPDPDHVQELVATVLGPFRLRTRRASYDAQVRHDPLGELSFTTVGYGNAVEIDVDGVDSKALVFQWTASGAFDARTAGPEQRVSYLNAHLVRPGTPLHMRCTPDCRFVIVSGDARELESAVGVLSGEPDRPRLLPQVVPRTGPGTSLARCTDFLHAEAQRADSPLRNGPGLRPALQMLFALIMQAIDEGAQPARPGRPGHVKRAQDFMLANLAGPIGIVDVVASAGVSMRTLYQGFQDCQGVSPMAWLRQRRLERIRAELMTGSPEETRVTEVALRWGLSHLGRFASHYRAAFGESPSQTLRRR